MQEAGVIREAVLTTAIDSQGVALYRLRLLAHCGKAPSLDLVIPEGMSLVRVRRDGTDVSPIRSGTSVSIPLPAASQGRSCSRSRSNTLRRARLASSRGRCAPCFPRFRFPVSRSRGSSFLPPVLKRSIAGPGFSQREREARRAGRTAALSSGDEDGICSRRGQSTALTR